ncbi:ABC transporter permease [Gryllotalpicola koreensis]|uniref:ABC-2 type transporter transmembrane domain-containing protein n=1 Tax=Gryllotalpicola koreensis TaxID=993086 RepID=A0ABP8A0U0_9MICO
MSLTTADAQKAAAPTAAAPRGIRARYRAWYEKMPPGVQMIGLQAWLPVFFVIAFLFCYVYAFHAPAFKNVPVAVVGPSSVMQPVAEQLQEGAKGAVTVRVIDSMDDAKAQVRRGDIAAAYAPGQDSSTLVVASAASFQLSSLAQQFFQGVAAQSDAKLQVDDLAPLPPNDSFGTSLFYLTLVCTIGGYMMSMFVGMMGGGLKHWQRFAIIGAASIVLPGIAIALGRFAIHAVDGNFWELWAIGAATSFAVGCVVNGLAYFMGRFVTGAALLVFVFANVPGSGGAYPPELVPQPFRALHDFVSGAATIGLFRRTVYDVGPEAWHFWLTLAVYAAIGTALAFAGKPYFVWLMGRRRRAGYKTMMISAQIASMTHAGYVTPVTPAGAGAAGVAAVKAGETDASAEASGEETAEAHAPAGAAPAQASPAPVVAHAAHAAPAVASQPGAPATVTAPAPQAFIVTTTAASDSGPVELTVRLQSAGEASATPTPAPAAADRHRRGRDREQEQRDAERGMDFSVEEADGDAVAAETGALG